MKRTIKITQKQLEESEDSVFKYLNGTDTKPNNGNSEVSATGKLNDKDDGKPLTTDKFASVNCPQGYNRYGSYGYSYARGVREGVSNDKDGDGVDDFYDNDEIDILGNGDNGDNLTKIPYGTDRKVNMLVSAMQTLTPKQNAIILNKIFESIDITSLSYNIKKLLIKKLTANK